MAHLDQPLAEAEAGDPRRRDPSPDMTTFKTELCARWVAGHCPWGDRCRFAHGADELKARQRPERYKTQLCRTFLANGGQCPYGQRCNFVHAFTLPDVPRRCVGSQPDSTEDNLERAAALAAKALALASTASPRMPPLTPAKPPASPSQSVGTPTTLNGSSSGCSDTSGSGSSAGGSGGG